MVAELRLLGCSALGPVLTPRITGFSHLRELKINSCDGLRGLPWTLGRLCRLRSLTMDACRSPLPESLGDLSMLKELCLWNCAIESFPDSFRRLTGLTRLDLFECTAELPDSVSRMRGLVDLVYTNHGRYGREDPSTPPAPDAIWGLVNLKGLMLSGTLDRAPERMGDLVDLDDLSLIYNVITALPETLGRLVRLRHLRLSYCYNLTSLPEGLGRLCSLEELYLDSTGLVTLPAGLSRLSNLRELNLADCKSLAALPAGLSRLSGLEVLDLGGCTSCPPCPTASSGG